MRHASLLCAPKTIEIIEFRNKCKTNTTAFTLHGCVLFLRISCCSYVFIPFNFFLDVRPLSLCQSAYWFNDFFFDISTHFNKRTKASLAYFFLELWLVRTLHPILSAGQEDKCSKRHPRATIKNIAASWISFLPTRQKNVPVPGSVCLSFLSFNVKLG